MKLKANIGGGGKMLDSQSFSILSIFIRIYRTRRNSTIEKK